MPLPAAGARVRSSDWTTVFPSGVDGWTTYVPTLTQGVTVTKNIEFAGWMKVGRLVSVQLSLAVTSAGTAGTGIVVGLPSAGTPVHYRHIGMGFVYDASTAAWFSGAALWASATTFHTIANGMTAALGGASFTAALASGDLVGATLTYQVAS